MIDRSPGPGSIQIKPRTPLPRVTLGAPFGIPVLTRTWHGPNQVVGSLGPGTDHRGGQTAAMGNVPQGTKITRSCKISNVSEPHGPIKINANRQIALPKALTDRLLLQPGDMVYVLQSDSEPYSLAIVPVERVSEWIRVGRAAERERPEAQAERMQDDV